MLEVAVEVFVSWRAKREEGEGVAGCFIIILVRVLGLGSGLGWWSWAVGGLCCLD